MFPITQDIHTNRIPFSHCSSCWSSSTRMFDINPFLSSIVLTKSYRVNMIYLLFLNKNHERRREQMGKSAKIVDRSMDAVTADGTEKESQTEQQVGDNALKDITDMENEDFVYVY